MTVLDLFIYEQQTVRTLTVDSAPWFVAADVCAVLDIGNPSDALRRLDDDERTLVSIDAPNGRPVNAVNEPGLYSLILGSRKPEAKAFKRWITHEVLPSIRQTGSYVAPMSDREKARVLAQAVLAAEDRIAELEPAAEAYSVLVDASGDHSLREAAQILSRDPDITVGQNGLAQVLRDIGWIDSRSRRPYQSQVNLGRLVARQSVWTDDEGATHVKYQPRITPKGVDALRKHLRNVCQLAVGESA